MPPQPPPAQNPSRPDTPDPTPPTSATSSKLSTPIPLATVSGSPKGGFLTFAGIAAAVAPLPAAEVRQQVDALLRTRLLRRGLVLRCSSCQRLAFVAVNLLQQANACPRCGHVDELTQQRWKEPVEEPAWFYDLHPVARELYEKNGDVPLLIAEYLRGSTRRFTDLAEIELFNMAGSAWPKPISSLTRTAESSSWRPSATTSSARRQRRPVTRPESAL